MRAQVLVEYGGPEAMQLREVEEPVAGPGQVRVRVAFAALNPIEWKLRSGAFREVVPLTLPFVPGNEVSGMVDQVGEGVDELEIGDRVAGFVPGGGDAEFVVTTPARLGLVPQGLSLRRAATLPQAAETAHRALRYISPQPGETVLVNAAAGAVGSAAVQILAQQGVTVVGTARPENHEYLRALGAVPIEYGEPLLEQLRAVAPAGIDAALDGGAHGFVDQVLPLVAIERIVTIADFGAVAKGVRLATGDPMAIQADDVRPVLALAAQGRFATEIAAEFALEDIGSAQALSERGHLRGKILVRVADLDALEPST